MPNGVEALTTPTCIGGRSYFSAVTDFLCDNVDNHEVVLASGEIVNANSEVNSDLFLALEGDSHMFGVVTRFELKIFKQGQMWGGAIYYNQVVYPQLVQAFNNFASSTSPEERTQPIVATIWSGGAEACVSNVYYSWPEAAPPSLKPFVDVQPQIFNSLSRLFTWLCGRTIFLQHR